MRTMGIMRAMRSAAIAGALAVYARSGTVAAQQAATAWGLAPGTRIRVTSMALQLNQAGGTVAGWQNDTLVFSPRECESSCSLTRIPADSIDRVQRFAGRSHLKGALVGTLVGGVLGVLVGAASLSQSHNCGNQNLADAGCQIGSAVGSVTRPLAYGGIGMLGGLAIGAAVGVGDIWRDVPVTDRRVSIRVVPRDSRTVAVAFSVGF